MKKVKLIVEMDAADYDDLAAAAFVGKTTEAALLLQSWRSLSKFTKRLREINTLPTVEVLAKRLEGWGQ